MGEWISGKDILVKNRIESPELIDFILNNSLQPYNQAGNPKPPPGTQEKKKKLKNLKDSMAYLERIKRRNLEPKSLREKIIKRRREQAGIDDNIEPINLKKEIKKLQNKLPQSSPYSWENYSIPNSDVEVEIIIKDLKKSYFKSIEVNKLINQNRKLSSKETSTEKKPRRNQIHRKKAREVAKKLWDRHPEKTIVDMIYENELNSVFAGKSYRDRTIRNWIKDLCPNRKPGRRPTK